MTSELLPVRAPYFNQRGAVLAFDLRPSGQKNGTKWQAEPPALGDTGPHTLELYALE
jgi:hypothetical protein